MSSSLSRNAWPNWLPVVLLLASCAQPATSPKSTPTATPAVVAVASPSPSPTPPPIPQQAEAPLPAQRQEVASTSAGDAVIYVIGGFDTAGRSSNSFFFQKDGWSTGPSYPLPIDHAAAATVGARLLVAGGYSNGAAQAAVYELGGEGWVQRSPMHHARGAHALVALGGRLFAIGGAAGPDVAPVEAYDTATDSWADVTVLPVNRNHLAGFSWKELACVAGGRSPNTPRVDCYDPKANVWSRLPDLPAATSGAGAVALGGRVIVAGGENAGESFLVNHVFRFDGTAWTDEPMLVPRHGIQLAVFRGRAWACGGATAAGYRAVPDCTSIG